MKEEQNIYIDFIDRERIDGWFINALNPKKNKVLLYLDGQHKATTCADIERQDVAEAYGQLQSGFYFDLTEFSIFNQVRLCSYKGEILLEFNVESVEDSETTENIEDIEDIENVDDKSLISVDIISEDKQIYIDSIDQHEVKGWFINTLNPENNKVLLYLDGQYKAITQANRPREDVEDAHGQLLSGFVFDLKRFSGFSRIELRSDDKEVLLKAEIESTEDSHDHEKLLILTQPYSYERHQQLEQIKIDLSKPVNGENWYEIESTGRWGGPELESTLNIPALSVGKYALEVAIENEFCGLEELKITLNNCPIKVVNTDFQTPVVLRAEVQIKEVLKVWKLGLNYPKTATPSDDSLGDQRELGIFLSAVTLTKINS